MLILLASTLYAAECPELENVSRLVETNQDHTITSTFNCASNASTHTIRPYEQSQDSVKESLLEVAKLNQTLLCSFGLPHTAFYIYEDDIGHEYEPLVHRNKTHCDADYYDNKLAEIREHKTHLSPELYAQCQAFNEEQAELTKEMEYYTETPIQVECGFNIAYTTHDTTSLTAYAIAILPANHRCERAPLS